MYLRSRLWAKEGGCILLRTGYDDGNDNDNDDDDDDDDDDNDDDDDDDRDPGEILVMHKLFIVSLETELNITMTNSFHYPHHPLYQLSYRG